MVPPTGFATREVPKAKVLRLWYKTGRRRPRQSSSFDLTTSDRFLTLCRTASAFRASDAFIWPGAGRGILGVENRGPIYSEGNSLIGRWALDLERPWPPHPPRRRAPWTGVL